MKKYTPGPWGWRGYRLEGQNDYLILDMEEEASWCMRNDANNRLIAAAPELLDTVKYLHPLHTPAAADCVVCALIARIGVIG